MSIRQQGSVARSLRAGLLGLALAAVPAVAAPGSGPFGTRAQSVEAPGQILPLAISARGVGPREQASAAALTRKLQSLYALASRTALLRQPRGFSMEPVLYAATRPDGGNTPFAGGLSLYFRPIYLDWASTQRDPQSGRYFTPHPNDGLSFLVNQPERLLGEELGRDAQGSFHTAPELVAQGNGWHEYRSHKYHLLAYIGNGRQPYRPISVERYLTHLIREARENAAAQADSSAEWSGYVPDAAPTQDELLAELRETERELLASGMSKSEVDAMLAPMRDTIATYQPVTLDKSEFTPLAEAADEAALNHLRNLEAELAALSPAQRNSPACQYLGEPRHMPASGLDIHCNDPRGIIVEANPGFFDPRLPREQVQLLVIHYFPRRSNDGAFSYLDIAHAVMDALRQDEIAATLR